MKGHVSCIRGLQRREGRQSVLEQGTGAHLGDEASHRDASGTELGLSRDQPLFGKRNPAKKLTVGSIDHNGQLLFTGIGGEAELDGLRRSSRSTRRREHPCGWGEEQICREIAHWHSLQKSRHGVPAAHLCRPEGWLHIGNTAAGGGLGVRWSTGNDRCKAGGGVGPRDGVLYGIGHRVFPKTLQVLVAIKIAVHLGHQTLLCHQADMDGQFLLIGRWPSQQVAEVEGHELLGAANLEIPATVQVAQGNLPHKLPHSDGPMGQSGFCFGEPFGFHGLDVAQRLEIGSPDHLLQLADVATAGEGHRLFAGKREPPHEAGRRHRRHDDRGPGSREGTNTVHTTAWQGAPVLESPLGPSLGPPLATERIGRIAHIGDPVIRPQARNLARYPVRWRDVALVGNRVVPKDLAVFQRVQHGIHDAVEAFPGGHVKIGVNFPAAVGGAS